MPVPRGTVEALHHEPKFFGKGSGENLSFLRKVLPGQPSLSPSPKHELAARAVRTLADAGHEAYFVGGCVRDLVMGIEPADYDIATSARPEAIRGLFDRTLDVGAAFGVVIVRIDGEQFEVATFRSDGGYSDGRHPDRVEFTDAEGDVRRRDFTINGMLYDPAGIA